MYSPEKVIHPVPIPAKAIATIFSQSGGKVILLYGDSPVFRFSLLMAAAEVSRGSSIAIVDGCNRFDVHLLSRFARERKMNADRFLDKFYISRGFTCYQMEAAIDNRLYPFLQSIGSTKAIIFGLLDTFYDEQAPFREVQQILHRLELKFSFFKDHGITIFIACNEWNVAPKERNSLFTQLRRISDKIFRLKINEDQKPKLYQEDIERQIINKGEHYGTNCTYIHESYR